MIYIAFDFLSGLHFPTACGQITNRMATHHFAPLTEEGYLQTQTLNLLKIVIFSCFAPSFRFSRELILCPYSSLSCMYGHQSLHLSIPSIPSIHPSIRPSVFLCPQTLSSFTCTCSISCLISLIPLDSTTYQTVLFTLNGQIDLVFGGQSAPWF
jgi:hypothetical protein